MRRRRKPATGLPHPPRRFPSPASRDPPSPAPHDPAFITYPHYRDPDFGTIISVGPKLLIGSTGGAETPQEEGGGRGKAQEPAPRTLKERRRRSSGPGKGACRISTPLGYGRRDAIIIIFLTRASLTSISSPLSVCLSVTDHTPITFLFPSSSATL